MGENCGAGYWARRVGRWRGKSLCLQKCIMVNNKNTIKIQRKDAPFQVITWSVHLITQSIYSFSFLAFHCNAECCISRICIWVCIIIHMKVGSFFDQSIELYNYMIVTQSDVTVWHNQFSGFSFKMNIISLLYFFSFSD